MDTAPLLVASDLDFFDFHAYPGGPSLAELAAAFGMADFNDKPIILGEYGAFRHIYSAITPAARAILKWQAESCTFGFDGWLYWTYYPAAATVGDRTWGMTDESGFLLDLLAPENQPDPCVETAVPSANLAYQKPARASARLPEEPPANAVDENDATQWGAGTDAPQWIEVDLGQAYHLTEIRLLVAQWPAGETVHRILGRSIDGDFGELTLFRQNTSGGDWLTFTPESPIGPLQIIRIETVSSPSWVALGEIQVFWRSESLRYLFYQRELNKAWILARMRHFR